MKSTRRGFLSRTLTIAAVVAVAPMVKAEAAPVCTDCERVWTRPVVLPDAFKAPPLDQESLRAAVHERAVRQSVSHEEAATAMSRESFPTLTFTPTLRNTGVGAHLAIKGADMGPFEAQAADCAARGCVLDSAFFWLSDITCGIR